MTSPTLATRTLLLLALIGAPLAIACTGPELGATETDQETGGSGIFIGSSSASEGGDQSAEAPDQCDLKAFDCPHRVNRPVMFVIDNSYSMRSERIGMWDDDGDDRDDDGWVDGAAAQRATPRVTRWSSLHDELALMGALFEDRLEMGMTLFPAFDPTAEAAPLCAVGATPEIPFGADWWEAMSGRKIPYRSDSVAGGAAPAAAAIDAALAALADREAEVPGAIVLVTDGAATCGSEPGAHDERLLEVVTAAKDRGVPTFVVGIDIPARSALGGASDPRRPIVRPDPRPQGRSVASWVAAGLLAVGRVLRVPGTHNGLAAAPATPTEEFMQIYRSSLIVIPVALVLAGGCAASRADRAARLEDANDRQEDRIEGRQERLEEKQAETDNPRKEDRLERREERLEERQEALDAHDGKNDPDRS